MEGSKTYQKPKRDIFNTLYDIIELQKGELIVCDTQDGKLLYKVTMYDYVWELLYSITDVSPNKRKVSIQCLGERSDKKREIMRQFSLLDSMLSSGELDIEYSE